VPSLDNRYRLAFLLHQLTLTISPTFAYDTTPPSIRHKLVAGIKSLNEYWSWISLLDDCRRKPSLASSAITANKDVRSIFQRFTLTENIKHPDECTNACDCNPRNERHPVAEASGDDANNEESAASDE
jgi:hypothetical protein